MSSPNTNFSFSRNLSPEDAVVRVFCNGFTSEINGADCRIRFKDNNRILCESDSESLYPIGKQNIMSSLENATFRLPVTPEGISIEIKKALLIEQHFEDWRTTTLFSHLENQEEPITAQRRFRIIIPQNTQWYAPDFSRFFYGTPNMIIPKGEFEPSQRIYVQITGTSDSGITFKYNGIQYVAYSRQSYPHRPQNQYMVIETLDVSNHDAVQKMALKIISAIGFFTANYPFGQMFVFDADTSKFISYNGCVISSATSKFAMISLNPYDYFAQSDIRSMHREHLDKAEQDDSIRIDGEPEILSRLRRRLTPIKATHFTNLLTLMESKRFMLPFHLLQALSTTLASTFVYARLSAYVSCIEMFKKWVRCDIAGEEMIPKVGSFAECECRIPAEFKKSFLLDIHQALNKVSAAINPDARKSIKNRLRKIFTKRLPNEEILKRPFELFKIDYSSSRDANTFKLRNDIAHGENPITAEFDNNDFQEYLNESEEKCFGFHALIWRLIMVAIGYHGIYRDLPKLMRLNRAGTGNDCQPVALEF